MHETQQQYWFARRSNNWWGRNQYAVVHWKGFLLLFVGVIVAFSLLGAGIYLLWMASSADVGMALKVASGFSGPVLIGIAMLTVMRINREKAERTDPELLAADYRQRIFKSVFDRKNLQKGEALVGENRGEY